MINTGGNVSITNNSFSDFNINPSEYSYWYNQKNNTQIKTSLPEILSPEEARKTHNTKTIGISIASATLLAAAGVFYLMRGGPKGFVKNINILRKNLENKLQQSKLDLEDNSFYNKFLQFSIKVTDWLQSKIDTLNNITTIKDLLFEKFMNNRLTGKITGKIHSYITKVFAKVARRAVKNSYSETLEKIKNSTKLSKKMLQNLTSANNDEIINIKGVEKTRKEWLKELSTIESDIFKEYEKNFGQNAQILRYKKYGKTLIGLKEQFKKNGPFWFLSKDTLKGFVADSIVANARKELQQKTWTLRKFFSYSMKDISKEADDTILEMTKLLKVSDVDNIKRLRNLNQNFQKLSHIKEEAERAQILNNIENQIDEFITDVITSNKIKTETGDKLYNYAQSLSDKLKNYKPGKLENMLSIYKRILSPEEYSKLENAYKGNVVALDKSIHLETEDYLNKLRDLTLGSAPTDVLSVAAGLGTLGYYLMQSDDVRERNEIGLKYGLPAITGIASMLYGNAKLLAGTKSLSLGLITMFITNRFGDIANKLLENYYSKQKNA